MFYIERFERLSEDRRPTTIKSLIVEFADLTSPTVGLCTVRSGKSPFIQIDRTFWESASDAAKENLMFHELGHCILIRGHKETKSAGIPDSLMFPSLIPYHYEKDKRPYINELFSIYGDWSLSLTEVDHTWICDHE